MYINYAYLLLKEGDVIMEETRYITLKEASNYK